MESFMKVFIAGHKGLVGSALCREAASRGRYTLITRDRTELDLRERGLVRDFMATEKPDWVLLAAAKVGGIVANSAMPTEFLLDNLRIQNSVIEACYESGVQKLLFLGSSCIYPRDCPQPIKEEYLLSGPLEKTNEAYSIAKIAGLKLCDAYNRQHGTNFLGVMPSNLYGPGDNYHPEDAHALPMLLSRMHRAKIDDEHECTVWGSGKPLREFLYVDDLASACFHLLDNCDAQALGPFVNVGSGEEVSIGRLAELIRATVGFDGELVLDHSRPDGTPRKLLDNSRIRKLGWEPRTSLANGLKKTYEDFLSVSQIRQ